MIVSSMDNLEKIELNTPQSAHPAEKADQPFTVMKKKRRFSFPKKTAGVFTVLLIILVVLGVITIPPVLKTYKSALVTYQQAKLVVDAMKNQNVALASEEIAKTKKSLTQTQADFKALSYVRFIPIANWYYADADHALKAAENGLESGTLVIDSLKPYTDILGLKGQGSFVMGSAEDRIKTAVMTMGKITPRIDEIAVSIREVRKEIDAIDANHYPEFIFGPKVKKQLQQVQELTDQSVAFVDEARPLIKVLPSLLGETGEKKYLILFQNDKELRASGGFLTGYAIFKIDRGIIKIEGSDDIYTLDNSIASKPKAPEPILKYLPKVNSLNLRDANLSPDFITSMNTFNELYNKASARTKVDGIIAIDTHVLVSTIKILDDKISAGGLTFTTKNDPRCDCPQVIYELENNISRPVNYVRTGRKDLLGDLLYAIMQRALSSSPKLYWGNLFQSVIAQTNQKHILFYLYDKEAQSGIEALNAAGRIQNVEGDYLHINDVNFGGAKSNLFVKHAVTVNYETKNDGSILKTVTINYKNPQEPSDCNLERGGLCLNAELRNWLRIYVPKGSQMTESKGSQVKMTTYDELEKTVFDGFLTVRPKGAATFTISYKLPFKLSAGSPLPVLIQKQPGTEGHEYTIMVNGKTKETFKLTADKELKLKL